MEYYGVINSEYLTAIKRPMRIMKIKIEMLDQYDNAIGCLENYMSSTEGTITVNLTQGCRRSCNISIIDKDKKFLPQQDSLFWYNRKFKIYIGLKTPFENLYWFSQGVYYTKTATSNGRVINIDGIDKYGMLNGELNTNMCDAQFQVGVSYSNSKKGTKIVDLIRDTLSLDMGNGFPLDTTEPLIDSIFYNETLYNDIVLEEGSYIGDLFDKIAEMYGSYIYYDVDGHLRMEKIFNDDMPYWYTHLAPEYNFGKINLSEDSLNVVNEFNGINTVTVVTDNTEGFIYSYTAQNLNPLSPVNVNAIGVRRYQDGNYSIPLSTSNNTSPYEKCRQQAQYLLMQSICDNLSINFEYPIVPHINVDESVYLTNEYFGFEMKPFVIQSLNIPLNGEPTTYEVVNIEWLPFDSLTLLPEVNYKEVQLVITAARSATDKISLSEFSLYNQAGDLIAFKYNETGNPADSTAHTVNKLIDNDPATKANLKFDSDRKDNKIIILFKLKDAVTLGSYQLITSDEDKRYDLKSWKLYARNDNTDWVCLDKQTDVELTEERNAVVTIKMGETLNSVSVTTTE